VAEEEIGRNKGNFVAMLNPLFEIKESSKSRGSCNDGMQSRKKSLSKSGRIERSTSGVYFALSLPIAASSIKGRKTWQIHSLTEHAYKEG